MTARFPLRAAGFFGATGVVAGAFGAHALRPVLLAHGFVEVWETAARYQMLHAVALLGLAAWSASRGAVVSRSVAWAAGCWSVGIVLFSGSLYLLAAGAPRWMGAVTPLGGAAFIAGWVAIACTAGS